MSALSIARFVWDLLPWYAWILLALAVVGLAYLRLLGPLLRAARAVPWPAWAILAAALAVHTWIVEHDRALSKAAEAHEKVALAALNATWKAREAAANEAHAQAIAALQLKLDTSLASARQAAQRHAAQLERERQAREAAEAELDRRRSENVTPEADRLCIVTRGVVRQFNAAAAVANGQLAPGDASSAGAGPGDADAPSGVPLSQLSHAVDDAGKAFGACRERVAAWESYHTTVIEPWIASTVEVLQSCIPKGATP